MPVTLFRSHRKIVVLIPFLNSSCEITDKKQTTKINRSLLNPFMRHFQADCFSISRRLLLFCSKKRKKRSMKHLVVSGIHGPLPPCSQCWIITGVNSANRSASWATCSITSAQRTARRTGTAGRSNHPQCHGFAGGEPARQLRFGRRPDTESGCTYFIQLVIYVSGRSAFPTGTSI